MSALGTKSAPNHPPLHVLHEIATAGTLAPSGDNLQPWRFGFDEGTLLIFDDPTRDHSLFNVRNLASYIALGAALENIMIAASKFHYCATIYYFPDEANTDLIARVCFDFGTEVHPLAEFIDRRCTNRKPYKKDVISESTLKSLEPDKERLSDIGLLWMHDPQELKKLGNVVACADRLLLENPLIHSQLFSTIRWNKTQVEATRDGLPIETLELGRLGSKAFRLLKDWSVVNLLNKVGLSRFASRQSIVLMHRCSAAGLIVAPNTSPMSFIRVGQAFQRLWLQTAKANLALQPMTAIIFLQLRSRLNELEGLNPKQAELTSHLRRELCALFHLSQDSVPAMLFRLGSAAAPSSRTVRKII